MTKTKQVKISEQNHQKLSDLGSKSDTFDDVISMLIENYEKYVLGVKKK